MFSLVDVHARSMQLGAFMKFIQKKITVKRMAILLTILYIIGLIPILMIAKYNFPGGDDFSIGENPYKAWLATHSVIQVIYQGILTAYHDYMHWSGTYTSIFFMAVHPGVYGEQFYALTTYLMIGMITFPVMYFLNTLLVKALHVNKYVCHCIAMVFLTVMIQCMVNGVEAYFWYTGAVHYIFPFGFTFLMLGSLIRAKLDESKKKRMFHVGFATFCAFFVGGGNYISGLFLMLILIVILGFMIKNKQIAKNLDLVFPMIFFMVAFVINAMAPGNLVRGSLGTGFSNPLKAVMVSFYYCLYYVFERWMTWNIPAMMLLLAPFLWKAVKNIRFSFRYPVIVAGASYCLVSATFAPSLYALGNIEAGRLQDIIFMTFLVLLLVNETYFLGWLARHLEVKTEKEEEQGVFSFRMMNYLVPLCAFLVFAIVISVIPDPDFYIATSAAESLLNGEAEAYGKTNEDRMALYHDPTKKDIIVQRYVNAPELLYFGDITEDNNSWENRGVCRFYSKNSAVLAEK